MSACTSPRCSSSLPFRSAHHVAGRLVKLALERGVTLAELPLNDLQAEHPAFEADVYRALDPEIAVERRSLPGGPARGAVRHQLGLLRARLGQRQLDLAQISQRYGVKTEP